MSEDGEVVENALSTVLSDGILVFLGRGVALAMGFFTQLIMARLLSTDAYGSVVVILAVTSIAQNIGRLGLNEGMVRKIPQHENTLKELRGVVKAGLIIGGLSALIFAGCVFVFADFISHRIFDNTDLTPLLRVGAFAIPFVVIGDISISIARGARNAKPHTVVNQILKPTLRFAFIGILVATGYEAIGAVTGQVVAFSIAGLAGLWFAYRTVPNFRGPSARMYRTMFVFSFPLVLVHGMNFLLSNTDTFLIEYFLTSSEVGIYNIAFQIRNLIIVLLVTVGFLLPPMLSKLETQNQYEELREVYQFVTKWVIIFTFPLFMSTIFIPHLWLGLLFGEKYLPAVSSLQILGVGIIFSAAVGVTKSALVGLGRNQVVMFTTLVAVVTNIILNIILIPRFGIEGAALASSVSIIILESLNAFVLYRVFRIIPVPTEAIGLVISMGASGLIMYKFLVGKSLVGLIVWCLFYILLVFFFVISKKDLTFGRKVLKEFKS